MLTQLTVSNFALIDNLKLDLNPGFSIITGETGAGKSILLGALGLILGKRADLSSLKNQEQKCVIEAHFSIKDYDLQAIFSGLDIDYDDDTIVRREILPSGKSRAFINDTPVNLNQLHSLGEQLVDIHSQHQTLDLSEESFQFELIDAFAGNNQLLSNYQQLLKSFNKNRRNLEQLKLQKAEAEKEHGYHDFLFQELETAQLKKDEQETLESSLSELSNAEAIQETVSRGLQLFQEESFGLLGTANELKSLLQKAGSLSHSLQQLSERMQSCSIELKDICSDLEGISDSLIQDPTQLEMVNQRLQLIYDLQKKHQVDSIEALLLIQEDLSTKTLSVESLAEQIETLEFEIQNQQQQLLSWSEELSQIRKNKSEDLSQMILGLLKELGMPDSRISFEFQPMKEFSVYGKESLELLFSANKGSAFAPLKKVASGGELSRIMLAVKAILAQYKELPTLIFDEIDTGVSGEIADKMAQIMKEMSKDMQIIAITHLPQIAAKGNAHYKVFKKVVDEKTQSDIRELTGQERVTEIAQMLSGAVISDSAINHAKALLN